MSDSRFHPEAGLTLPELLIVSFVFVTLLGLVQGTFRYQTMNQRREGAKTATQTDLRVWVDRMVRDVRSAGYDPRETNLAGNIAPLFTITALSASEIRFTTDWNGNGTLQSDARENIGYRLNGGVLELWRGGTSWRPVLQGVTSLVFTCFNSQGTAITCAASPQSIRRSIAAVGIALSAQAETGGVPTMGRPVITQKATAELRNEIL